jgi:hypothetical protein
VGLCGVFEVDKGFAIVENTGDEVGGLTVEALVDDVAAVVDTVRQARCEILRLLDWCDAGRWSSACSASADLACIPA